MRRVAPRPLGLAIPAALEDARPATLLARVQGSWSAAAGEALAAVATPVSEADGVVTFACESAVWAQELDLLAGDLRDRLADLVAQPGSRSVERLRFVVRSPPNEG